MDRIRIDFASKDKNVSTINDLNGCRYNYNELSLKRQNNAHHKWFEWMLIPTS
jgi:hypothetical protein